MAAQKDRKQATQLHVTFPDITIEDSYAISTEVSNRKIKAGARLIGHKVGLTSKAMQRSSMIDEPDYGYILDDQLIADGAKVKHADYCKPRVEVELAFVMIVDVPNSGVALAINQVTRDKNKVFVGSGPATSDLTGPKCSPNTVHWTYDTWMLANGTGKAVVKTGGDTWFFLTSDYAFGHALERDTMAVVEANGGKVLGKVRHPINSSDFSSFLLQAQSSKAKVIGLANAGGDTINSIKQASEFGIVKGGQSLAGLLVFATDVNALGLQTAQGLVLTETFYWDLNDATRAWTKRWHAERNAPNKYPAMNQAGVYAGTLHYLKAVLALKSAADGKAVVAKMKELPTDDSLFGKGTIRADGRKLHPAYLFEVKKPEESKYPGDFYKLRATIPADEAFRPLKEGNCPLVSG